ncbi:MAG: nitroreductase family deazaflavin-dependent oxidoreductase [Anaerolineales bacterium]|nr:nitroreductase family deazaflavin-dependent oxidoreductase [Anaerolineales bacterium]
MDKQLKQALAQDQVIDITTIGRKTGRPRRIEIWFHRWNGRYYITGLPGKRSWYANLLAHPEFTFHLKGSAQADLPARARPILAEEERRKTLTVLVQNMDRLDALDEWMTQSPLVEVEFI